MTHSAMLQGSFSSKNGFTGKIGENRWLLKQMGGYVNLRGGLPPPELSLAASLHPQPEARQTFFSRSVLRSSLAPRFCYVLLGARRESESV